MLTRLAYWQHLHLEAPGDLCLECLMSIFFLYFAFSIHIIALLLGRLDFRDNRQPSYTDTYKQEKDERCFRVLSILFPPLLELGFCHHHQFETMKNVQSKNKQKNETRDPTNQPTDRAETNVLALWSIGFCFVVLGPAASQPHVSIVGLA